MTLEITVDHDGTEYAIDFDELVSHGEYFRDPRTGIIIRTSGNSEGADSEKHGIVETGTDFQIAPVEIDHPSVRRQLYKRLEIRLTDDELDNLINDYQTTSCVFADHVTQAREYQLLERARKGILSVDVDKGLRGLNEDYDDIVDRALEADPEKSPGDVWSELFAALQHSSPGDETYAAKVELVD
jgi:hypothetical protein